MSSFVRVDGYPPQLLLLAEDTHLVGELQIQLQKDYNLHVTKDEKEAYVM